jgi:hypothetical protein
MLIPSESVSPAWIVYWNTSEVLPLPEAYVAVRFVLPTTKVSVGVPLALSTMTDSLKVAVTDTTSPAFSKLFCDPVALLIATLFTEGAVSITIILEPEDDQLPTASRSWT